MKKKTSIDLCNCHKDGNLSWHFLDYLVHGRYTGPLFRDGGCFRLAAGHGRQVTLIPSLIIEQFSQDLFRLALVDRKPLLSGVVMYMFDCLFIYVTIYST